MTTLDTRSTRRNVLQILRENPDLAGRYQRIKAVSGAVRTSEYHITNACNIRCKDCWFFAHNFPDRTREIADVDQLEAFVESEVTRGITAALLIGGEPTLFPERIEAFVERMPYVTVSSNGLRRLPYERFENVTIALTLFGGYRLDDTLRGYRPNGKRFGRLFETALENYEGDDRVGFVYAITEKGIGEIETTVERIRDNGNRLVFNYFSQYSSDNPLGNGARQELLEEALRVKSLYPDTVVSHPYYIKALITGRTEWGTFGYHSCPSISTDYAGHEERKKNGNPVLPMFNTYAADMKTVAHCCTSGDCSGCRDSQAVMSWLLVNVRRFATSEGAFRTWLELAESYWENFKWTPISPREMETAGCRPEEG